MSLIWSRLGGEKVMSIKKNFSRGQPPVSDLAMIKQVLDEQLLPSKKDSYEERLKQRIVKNRANYFNRCK